MQGQHTVAIFCFGGEGNPFIPFGYAPDTKIRQCLRGKLHTQSTFRVYSTAAASVTVAAAVPTPASNYVRGRRVFATREVR